MLARAQEAEMVGGSRQAARYRRGFNDLARSISASITVWAQVGDHEEAIIQPVYGDPVRVDDRGRWQVGAVSGNGPSSLREHLSAPLFGAL